MYHKLYKRSAEKWQEVAILQKRKKVYILSGPLWYTLTEKPTSGYLFHTILGCFGKCFLVLFQFLPNI